MAVTRRRRAAPQSLGIRPTAQQKLIHTSRKLGLPGMENMQGSSFNIFDTLLIDTNTTGRTTLEFFANATNKSLNFSNFQTMIANAGESLIMKDISFALLSLSAADLTKDSTNIIDIFPISAIDINVLTNKSAPFHMAVMDIVVANQKVVKQYNLMETNPNYNPKTTGVGAAQGAIAGPAIVALDSLFGQNQISLVSAPMLPPNQKLSIVVSLPPLGTVGTGLFLALTCIVGKVGSIFSGKTTL